METQSGVVFDQRLRLLPAFDSRRAFDVRAPSGRSVTQAWTHPVPEHIGGVPPTVLVVLLAAAIRNHFLLEGLVPVGVDDDAAALPLAEKNRPHGQFRLRLRSVGTSEVSCNRTSRVPLTSASTARVEINGLQKPPSVIWSCGQQGEKMLQYLQTTHKTVSAFGKNKNEI